MSPAHPREALLCLVLFPSEMIPSTVGQRDSTSRMTSGGREEPRQRGPELMINFTRKLLVTSRLW